MNILFSTLLADGVPYWVLRIALNATGQHGGARLTTALSSLGPGGMYGGLASLAVIQAVTFLLGNVIVDRIYIGVIRELLRKGYSTKEIEDVINKLQITTGLKEKLRLEAFSGQQPTNI